MKTLPLSEVKAKLSKLVREVDERDERVMITRNGRPAAVLVSPDEIASLEATIEILRDPDFVADIRRGMRQLERGKAKTYRDLNELFGPKR